jgi:hypothetical protein
LRIALRLALLTAAPLMIADGRAADLSARPEFPVPGAPAESPHRSIHFFAGRLSTQSIGDTAIFNISEPGKKNYDNAIVGFAYQHDFWRWHSIIFGFEAGIADRFGPYSSCCKPPVRGGTIHSGEIWGGLAVRHQGLRLTESLRLAPGLVVGVSAVTKTIGREREREITQNGDASVLIYAGPEIGLYWTGKPELELVLRLHHRSGAGTQIGKMQEGYNASVLGIRYRF